MSRDESLEVAALRALAGEAQQSPDNAARLLEDSGLRLEDVGESMRPLWAVVVERLRRRVRLDFVGIRNALKDSPQRLREVALDVLSDVETGATERLGLLHDAGTRARYVAALEAASVASKAGAPLAELERLAKEAGAGVQSAGGRVRNCRGDSLAMLDGLMAKWGGESPMALTTGWDALDAVVGGLPANLVAIGARTGVGKSALVAGLVRNWLTSGVKVGLLSYEDDTRDMWARLVALKSGVTLAHSRGAMLPNEAQRYEVAEALTWVRSVEELLETDDARPTGTPEDVVASMRAMKRRGCRVAILDNLSCTRMDGGEERFDLVLEKALYLIRDAAQSLDMPALVVGHIRRGQTEADESRRPPRPSDFRNGGAWENASRLMLGMWLDGDAVALRVLKQTNGAAWPTAPDFTCETRKEAAVVTGLVAREVDPAPAVAGPKRYARGNRYQSEDAS
jgi:hypothetical protein